MLPCCKRFSGSNLVGKRGCFSESDLIFCSMLTEDEHSLDCYNEDDAGFPNNHDFLLEKHLLILPKWLIHRYVEKAETAINKLETKISTIPK